MRNPVVIAATVLALLAGPAQAQISDGIVKIGVLNDQSSLYADLAGQGSVRFRGEELIDRPSNLIARRGLAFCPEERGIFASLSVEENLLLPPVVQPGGLGLDAIYDLFPNLRERGRSQGTKLSGGEQQMLAIGRILRTGARLLLLDEPTEGLAPVIVRQIRATIGRLRAQGFTILLVEQNFRFAATVADRHYVMERGRVVDMIGNAELPARTAQLHEYLGV